MSMHRFTVGRRWGRVVVLAVTLGLLPGAVARAGGLAIDPLFADHYSVSDLGAVAGVPAPYGGLVFALDDPDVLLVAGRANDADGAIYLVRVLRACNETITGFDGAGTVIAAAARVDGGLCFGPDGILMYTTHDTNTMAQILAGKDVADRVFDLAEFGVETSTGALQFVPGGFDGASRLKLTSRDGDAWYDVVLGTDGAGKPYILDVAERASSAGGPSGIVYVGAQNPRFDRDHVLIAKFRAGRLDAYDIDVFGDPRPESRQLFLSGAAGLRGGVMDPVTGDVLLSAADGAEARVLIVRGFVDECSADVAPATGDDVVDVHDLLEVLSSWGLSCVHADVNADGRVDYLDVIDVLSAWGACR